MAADNDKACNDAPERPFAPPTGSVAWCHILAERALQDQRWGEQNHHPAIWLTILMEEVGEASKHILEGPGIRYRDEMVQVAAVAIAAIECWDRNNSPNTKVSDGR